MVGFPASHVKPEGKSHPTRTTRISAAVPWNRGGCFAKTPLDGQKTCCSTWVLSRVSIGPGGAAGYIFSNPQKETQAKWVQVNDTLYYLFVYIFLLFFLFVCVHKLYYTYVHIMEGNTYSALCIVWESPKLNGHLHTWKIIQLNIRCFKEGNLFAWCLIWLWWL